MNVLAGFVFGIIVATPVCVVVVLIGMCLRRPFSEIVAEAGEFAAEIALDSVINCL